MPEGAPRAGKGAREGQREWFFKDPRLPFVEARRSLESSGSFKPHLHHAFCLGAIEEGEADCRVGTSEFILRPGCLILVNPITLHACNAHNGDRRSFSMLYLDRQWCTTIQQSLWGNESFLPVDCHVACDLALFHLYVETLEAMKAQGHLQEKEQRLVHLLETVFARCCYPIVPIASPAQQVVELREWLGRDLEQDFTLQHFAAERGVNPYTLLRHFRMVYGIPPYGYRMNCRIERARLLLQQGQDIADVALLCGFFDQSHFHRHFKALTSVTPKQYRDNFLPA